MAVGSILCNLERYGEAHGEFARALGLYPDCRQALAGLGEACFMLGRYEEALAAERSAAVLAPGDAGLLGRIAETLRALGRAEEALAAADDALAAAPIDGRALALALKAYLLLDLGRADEADLYWLRAEAFAPDKAPSGRRGTSGCGARRWRRSRLRPRRRNGSDARRARPSAFSPALNRISRSEPIRRRI